MLASPKEVEFWAEIWTEKKHVHESKEKKCWFGQETKPPNLTDLFVYLSVSHLDLENFILWFLNFQVKDKVLRGFRSIFYEKC